MKRFYLIRIALLLLCCTMLLPSFAACGIVEDYLEEMGYLPPASSDDSESTTTKKPSDPDDATPSNPDDSESTLPDSNPDDSDSTLPDNTPDDSETTTPPPAEEEEPEPVLPIVSSVAQMQLGKDAGMCYIIQIKDGRFIVIDGGVSDLTARNNMLLYMQQKSNTEKPVIACWIITHMDGDHFNNAYAFLTNSYYRSSVEVQGFAYTFPNVEDFAIRSTDSDYYKKYKQSAIDTYNDKIAKWDKIKQLYPDVNYWDMKANDKKSFADVDIHVLITANERLPESVHTHNLRSAAFKMTFTQGTTSTADDKSFMVFGDCSGSARAIWMINKYGSAILKSDVMQVIHHGLAGGDKNLYKVVNPDICLWPTHKERFEGKADSDGDGILDATQHCVDMDYNKYLRDDSIKKREHYHHSQTTVIDMLDLSVSFWNP